MACKTYPNYREIAKRFNDAYGNELGRNVAEAVVNQLLGKMLKDGNDITEQDLEDLDDIKIYGAILPYIFGEIVGGGGVIEEGTRHGGRLEDVNDAAAQKAFQVSNAYIGYNRNGKESTNHGIASGVTLENGESMGVNEFECDGNTVAYVNIEAYTDVEKTMEKVMKVLRAGGRIVLRPSTFSKKNKDAIKAWKEINAILESKKYGAVKASDGYWMYGRGCPFGKSKVDNGILSDDEASSVKEESKMDIPVQTTFGSKIKAANGVDGTTMFDNVINGKISAVSVTTERSGDEQYESPKVRDVVRLTRKHGKYCDSAWVRVTAVTEYTKEEYEKNAEEIGKKIGVKKESVKSDKGRAVIEFKLLCSEVQSKLQSVKYEKEKKGKSKKGKSKKGEWRCRWYYNKREKKWKPFFWKPQGRAKSDIGNQGFIDMMKKMLDIMDTLVKKGENVDASVLDQFRGKDGKIDVEKVDPSLAEVNTEDVKEMSYQADTAMFGNATVSGRSYLERMSCLDDVFMGNIQLKREFVNGIGAEFLYEIDERIRILKNAYRDKLDKDYNKLSKKEISKYNSWIADLEANGLEAVMRIPGGMDYLMKYSVFKEINNAIYLAKEIEKIYSPDSGMGLDDFVRQCIKDKTIKGLNGKSARMALMEIRLGIASKLNPDNHKDEYRALIDGVLLYISQKTGVKLRTIDVSENGGKPRDSVDVEDRTNEDDGRIDDDKDMEEPYKDGWMIWANYVSSFSTVQNRVRQKIGMIRDMEAVTDEKTGKVKYVSRVSDTFGFRQYIDQKRVWAFLLNNYNDIKDLDDLRKRLYRDSNISEFSWLRSILNMIDPSSKEFDEQFASGLFSSVKKSHTSYRHFDLASEGELLSFGSNYGESSEAIFDMMRRNVQLGFRLSDETLYNDQGLTYLKTNEGGDKVNRKVAILIEDKSEYSFNEHGKQLNHLRKTSNVSDFKEKAKVMIDALRMVGVDITEEQLDYVIGGDRKKGCEIAQCLYDMLVEVYNINNDNKDSNKDYGKQFDMFSRLRDHYEILSQLLKKLGDDRVEQMAGEKDQLRYCYADPNKMSLIAEEFGKSKEEIDEYLLNNYFMDGDGASSFFSIPVIGRAQGWLTDMQNDELLRNIFSKDTHTIISLNGILRDGVVGYEDYKRNDITVMALTSYLNPKTNQSLGLNSMERAKLAGYEGDSLNGRRAITFYMVPIMADSKEMVFMPGYRYSVYGVGEDATSNTLIPISGKMAFNKEEYIALRKKYAYVALQEYDRINRNFKDEDNDNLGAYERNKGRFNFLTFLNGSDGKLDEDVFNEIAEAIKDNSTDTEKIIDEVGKIVMRRLRGEISATMDRYNQAGLFGWERFGKMTTANVSNTRRTIEKHRQKLKNVKKFIDALLDVSTINTNMKVTDADIELLNTFFQMNGNEDYVVDADNFKEAVDDANKIIDNGDFGDDLRFLMDLVDGNIDTFGDVDAEYEGFDNTEIVESISETRDKAANRLDKIFIALQKANNKKLFNIVDGAKSALAKQSAKYDDIITNQTELVMTEYIMNNIYAKTQMIMLTTGDLSHFGSVAEFTKRNKEIYAAYKRLAPDATWNGEEVLYIGNEVAKEARIKEKNGEELSKEEKMALYECRHQRVLYLSDFKMRKEHEDKSIDDVLEDIKKYRAFLNGETETDESQHLWSTTGYFGKSNLWEEFILPELIRAKDAGEVDDNDIIEYFEAYSDFEASDGQSFRTLSSYRKVMMMTGNWDDKKEEDYQSVIQGTADYNTIKLLCDTIKPYCYSYEVVEKVDTKGRIYRVKVPVQHKNSEMILMTMIASKAQYAGEDSVIAGIGQAMVDNNIDVIHFNSVVKVGGFNAIDITGCKNKEEVRRTIADAISNREDEKKGKPHLHDYIHRIPWSDYGIQVGTKEHHEDTEIGFGTQIMKLIPADIPENFAGQPTMVKIMRYVRDADGRVLKDEQGRPIQELARQLSKQEFIDLYRRTLIANIKKGYDKLYKEIGTKQGVCDAIIRAIKQSDRYSNDLIRYIGLNDEGDFIMPLDHITIIQDIESLFASMVRKGIVKQDVAGGTLIQATGIGLSRDLKCVTEDDPVTGRKRIKYVECMAPAYLKSMYELYMKSDGTLDIEKMEQDAPEMLDMIGYRVPTEHMYSTVPLRIVGFTNKENSSAILLPQEIVVWSGSDFDVDKLYMMFPELKTVKDDSAWESAWKSVLQKAWEEAWNNHQDLYENAQNLRLGDIEAFVKEHAADLVELNDGTTQTVGSLFNGVVDNMRNGEFDKLFVPLLKLYKSITGKDLNDSLSDDDQKIMTKEVSEIMERIHREEYAPKTKLEYATPDYDKAPEDMTDAERNNLLLELSRARMTSDFAFLDMMRPGGFTRQKKMSYVTTIINTSNWSDLATFTNVQLEIDGNGNVTDKFISDIRNALLNMRMKALKKKATEIQEASPIGICSSDMFEQYHVQNMTGRASIGAYALQNVHHATMQGSGERITSEIKKYFNVVINGVEAEYLDKVYDVDGKSIIRNIGGFLAASVDNAKDPILDKLFQNKFTLAITCALLRMGYSLSTVILLMNSSTVRTLCGGMLNSDFYGGNPQKMLMKSLTKMGVLDYAHYVDEGKTLTDNDFIRDAVENKDGSNEELRDRILSLIKSVVMLNQSIFLAMQCTKIDVAKNSMQKNHAETYNILNKITSFEDVNQIDFVSITLNDKGDKKAKNIFGTRKIELKGDTHLIQKESESFTPEDYMTNRFHSLPHIQAFFDYGIVRPMDNIFGQFMKTYSEPFRACYEALNALCDRPEFRSLHDFTLVKFLKDFVLFRTIRAYKQTENSTLNEERRQWLRSFPRHFKEVLERNKDDADQYTFLKNITPLKNEKESQNLAKYYGHNEDVIYLEFALTGKMDKATRDVFTAEWEQMAYSDNDELAKLARDLVSYSMMLNGCDFGRGMGYFAPLALFYESDEYIEALRNIDAPMDENDVRIFVDQFVRNNIGNCITENIIASWDEDKSINSLSNSKHPKENPTGDEEDDGNLTVVESYRVKDKNTGEEKIIYKWDLKDTITVNYKKDSENEVGKEDVEDFFARKVEGKKVPYEYVMIRHKLFRLVDDNKYNATYKLVDQLNQAFKEYDPTDADIDHVYLDYTGEGISKNYDVSVDESSPENTEPISMDDLLTMNNELVEKIEPDENGNIINNRQFYVINSEDYERVHNVIFPKTTETLEMRVGAKIGNVLDSVLRDVLPTLIENREKKDIWEGVDINKERFAEFSTDPDFIEKLKDAITDLVKNKLSLDEGDVVHTNEIVLWHEYNGRKIAGTVDMLVEHADGTVSIYDFKSISRLANSKEGSAMDAKYKYTERWTKQLNAYRSLFVNMTGMKVRDVKIIPIQIPRDINGDENNVTLRSSKTINKETIEVACGNIRTMDETNIPEMPVNGVVTTVETTVKKTEKSEGKGNKPMTTKEKASKLMNDLADYLESTSNADVSISLFRQFAEDEEIDIAYKNVISDNTFKNIVNGKNVKFKGKTKEEVLEDLKRIRDDSGLETC